MSAEADHTGPALRFSAQFGFPRGPLGHIAGLVMAFANRGANRLVIELLDVQPEDYVLEVGCGPGAALADTATKAKFSSALTPPR